MPANAKFGIRCEFMAAVAEPKSTNLPVSLERRLQLLKSLLLLWITAGTSLFVLAQTATTTSLSLTSGSNSVTSVTAGTMITLTASVAAGATTIKQGQVNFCDADATYCTDIHLLGTSQITSSGVAKFHLRPAPGHYSYRAIFVGTPKTAIPYAASASRAAALTVTGKAATATTIVQSGTSPDYTLTASVLGFTGSQALPVPGGSASFIDTSTSNSVLGMATLSPVSQPVWVNASNPAVGSRPSTIITGDFDGDGNQDAAVGINSVAGGGGTPSASILLGDGRGNFASAPGGPVPADGVPLAIADFNQDGIPDLVVSDALTGSMSVALGKGDGTFVQAPGSPLLSNYGVSPVAVADFNGDGLPDIAAAGGYYLIVWLGNGDGSFTEAALSSSLVEPNLASMIVSDFNGDGIPDLAGGGESVSVYFGNGDGTFTAGPTTVVTPVHSGIPPNVTAGDFNGDGKTDIAVPIPPSGVIAILLGNGDGTFQTSAVSPTVGQWANRVAVGDLNGDGIADIYVDAETSLTNVFVLLGNGDGTFSVVANGPPQQPCCWSTAVADFNGDGVSDLASTDFYNDAVDVFLTGAKQSTASITGVSVSGLSPQQVIATYPGDVNYLSSQSQATALLAPAAAPVFSPAPGGIIAIGQTISITSSTPQAGIYYQISGAMQTGGYAQYFSPIVIDAIGTVSIQAYAAAYNYGQSTTITATYTVLSSDPVPMLTSASPTFAVAGSGAFPLTVNGSGFVSTSTVYFGTTALSTQFVNADQLTAQVPAAAIATAGVKAISVQNPPPGGGISNSLQFELDSDSAGAPVFGTTPVTTAAGGVATYPVTLPYSATGVSVQCLNLPSGASCSYSATAATLNITTSASTPAGTYQITAVFTETLPAPVTAMIFIPLGFAIFAHKGRKRSLTLAALPVLLLVSAIGCGGGRGGTTHPQHRQVTSSGTITLIVQ